MFNPKTTGKAQKGQAFVEYAVMLVFVSIGMILVFDTMGSTIQNQFQKIVPASGAGINFEAMDTDEPVLGELPGDEEDADNPNDGIVIPIFECTENLGHHTYVAHFGYNNLGSTVVDQSIGPDNMFTGSSNDQGQPTSFAPGLHEDVFTVEWNGSSNLAWRLLWQATGHDAAQEATADKNVTCP